MCKTHCEIASLTALLRHFAARGQSAMSALRDLLRLTAAEAVLRPTAMLRTSAMTPCASGTAGRTSKPVRWCCCNVESSTTFKSRQASQQTRSLTGHSSCESAVCATPYSAFARKDVRCCCAHAWSRSLTLWSHFLARFRLFVTAETLVVTVCRLSVEQLILKHNIRRLA